MANAIVVWLDDFRPRVTEYMLCLFCGHTHLLKHVQERRPTYYPCPGCDETASVPEWSVPIR
jgi:hypothetical protein